MTTITSSSPTDSLTSGWEPEHALDPGDTVVRRFLLNFAEFHKSAAVANGGWVHQHDQISIASSGRPASFLNSAVVLQPPVDDDWDVFLSCVDGVFGREGTGEGYLWSLWPTPDLRERGWELEGHPPLLVRQPGGRVPIAPAALGVRRVTDEATLADWERVAVEGYPLDDLLPFRAGSFMSPAILDDERWRLWVGYEGARPVSIGTQFVSHGFAQYALGVTLPEARGRGHWYGLVRERMLAEPGLVSGGIFGDDSRPGIEKLGYLPVIRFTLWRRPAQ
jgi:hypothetical protein